MSNRGFTPSFIRPPKPHRRGSFHQDRGTVETEDHTNLRTRTPDQRLRFETTDEERAKRIRMPTLKFLTNPEAKS